MRSDEEIAQTEIEFNDRFGELPDGLKDLFYQMKVKLAGEAVGLDSISMINQQLVLSYPPLPAGIKQRELTEIDPIARRAHAWWINLKTLGDESWQEALPALPAQAENE